MHKHNDSNARTRMLKRAHTRNELKPIDSFTACGDLPSVSPSMSCVDMGSSAMPVRAAAPSAHSAVSGIADAVPLQRHCIAAVTYRQRTHAIAQPPL